MSTLSKTRLKNIIKKYIQDTIHDFDLEKTTSARSLRSGMSVERASGKFLKRKRATRFVLPLMNRSHLKNKDFGSRSRRSQVLTRRHTQVCRGLKTRLQRRGWAKRLFGDSL